MFKGAKILVVTIGAVLFTDCGAAAGPAGPLTRLTIDAPGLVPIHRWQDYHCHRRRGFRRWCHQGAGRRSDDADADGANGDASRRTRRRRGVPRSPRRWRDERALPERYPPRGWPPSHGGRTV